MMKLIATIAISVLALTSASAADCIPDRFVGSWCAGAPPAGYWDTDFQFYSRSKTCKAHEPEDDMTIKPDGLQFMGDVIDCKFLETV